MKKYFLILTAAATTSVAFAQKTKVQTAYSYNKAFERNRKCTEIINGLEAINLAIDHDVTRLWAKTWKYRGDLYYNAVFSDDKVCNEIDKDALDKCADSYLKGLVLNFEDPELKKIDFDTEEGVKKLFAALQNQPKMDNNELFGLTMAKLPSLSGKFANKGIEQFGKKNYKGAQESFGKSLMFGQFSGRLDTMMLYNSALAAEYAEDFPTAKQTYDMLILLKYNSGGAGPDLYRSMSRIYKNEGNAEKAMEYIKKGREAYPNNNNLIVEELEDYLKNDKHEEALTNLKTAIANDPNNPVLHFAKGTVHESLKQEAEAIASYEKALEVKPDYYDASFNLGAYFFNKGADKINEANKLPLSESKKYDAFKAEAKAEFEKAVPYIEKAHNLKPEDVDTGNMLIKLYTHTGQYDKVKEIKAKYQ